MKTIGLIGGITWESTVTYYAVINRETQRQLGGVHSARIVMHSVDFQDIVDLQNEGRWDDGAVMLSKAASDLVRCGAEVVLMCCNTMHLVAPEVEQAAGVKLLHIADPLGAAIRAAGLQRVALLGTLFTMRKEGVLIDRLRRVHGLDVITPDDAAADEVHRMIYAFQKDGLSDATRERCRAIADDLVARGAEGLILGCTELPLMLKTEDSKIPQFDTATLHALAAVKQALA